MKKSQPSKSKEVEIITTQIKKRMVANVMSLQRIFRKPRKFTLNMPYIKVTLDYSCALQLTI